MGYAKYLEDDISIFNSNMFMKNNICFDYNYINKPSVAKTGLTSRGIKKAETKSFQFYKTNGRGRQGLAIYFNKFAKLTTSNIRKMQMHGWWWSKKDCCWYNTDTECNRSFAYCLVAEFN